MSAHGWKPGDVAMVTREGTTRIALRGEQGWSFANMHSWLGDAFEHEARRLVVIDPEDTDQIARLVQSLIEVTRDPGVKAYLPDLPYADVKAALREFANPKPSEPTDPRARVTDRRQNIWRLLADGEWVCTSGPDIGEYVVWSRLAAERGPLEVEVVTA